MENMKNKEIPVKAGRFKDAPWFPKDRRVDCLIGGSGGIGSWLTLLLNRATFGTIIFDFDTLEEHNLAGQFYSSKDIGLKKVEALKAHVENFTGNIVLSYDEKYTKDSMAHDFTFSAFDNMESRRIMFENWKKNLGVSSLKPIFIDGRLTAEQLQIFCVTPDRVDDYEKHLFNDSEVQDLPCTLKQTSHTAAMIASHMVGFFTNHITNVFSGENERVVPFKWEYFTPLNLIEEEL